MLNRIAKYIKQNEMIKPGDQVIVGVSGGPDSIALLHIMKLISQEMDFSITCAHLNHCLREQALAEELFVKNKCCLWDIPFYARTVAVRDVAEQQKKSLEEAGRNCRYQFFAELMDELNAASIATAHHHDDVAETVLLHLLRGTGLRGLRGIVPVSGSLIRPLLTVKKTELIDYLNVNGIDYCRDLSNEDIIYTRNRIRHQLIPYIQREFNPQFAESLNQLAIIAREENQVIEEETQRLWQDIAIRREKEIIVLDTRLLASLKPAYQRRIIKNALSLLAGELEWNMEDTNMVIELAARAGSSRLIHLKKEVRVNKAYNELIFTTLDRIIKKYSYPVMIPGKVTIKETGDTYLFDLVECHDFQPAENEIYLDYEKIGTPVVLRSRKDGDRFQPLGFNGHKKIKNFFIDKKVPLFERDKIPILAAKETIYAIIGYQIAEQAAVTEKTRQFVVIKKENNDNNNK
jgi:tRNA(Ile)-lysidine synthase